MRACGILKPTDILLTLEKTWLHVEREMYMLCLQNPSARSTFNVLEIAL